MIPVGTRVKTQIEKGRLGPVFNIEEHRRSGITGVVNGFSYEDQSISVLHDDDEGMVVGYWADELTVLHSAYLLVIDQDNRCRDSIHCGTLVWPLRATSLTEAEAEAVEVIAIRDGFGEHNGLPVDQALIYKVESMSILDVKTMRDTFLANKKAEEEARTEAMEREHLARLLEKYGPP